MKTIDFSTLTPNICTRSSITIGVFDGVHRGHQALLEQTRKKAQDMSGEAIVVTFTQHPQTVITGKGPASITSLQKRFSLFEEFGLTLCVPIQFDAKVASISPEDFVTKYLVECLGVKEISIGDNFRFGQGGRGTPETLKKLGEKHNFRVEITAPIEDNKCGEIISSTVVRKYVQKGNMELARRLLGRPFSLLGTVVHGEQRGRELGFPTANLDLHHDLIPPSGVYNGMTIVQEKIYPSLISIGHSPTFGENIPLKAEVYLEGFSGDLYGQNLETHIFSKSRDQETYSNTEELCQQMEKDKKNLLKNWSNEQISLSSSEEKLFSSGALPQDFSELKKTC